MTKLSTRSYMVLGLLAIRDWTTYDLAQQMKRGFGDIWSTSRSMVFEEPKQLVERGLARAKTERVGQRTRTRYQITAKGRAALRRWLLEPGEPPAMQFEGLLKVLLADTANVSTVGPTLATARQWSDQMRETGLQVAAEYASGRGPFQDRAAVVSMSFAFLWDFAELVGRWASWAESQTGDRADIDDLTAFNQALDGRSAVPVPSG
jgi:PadR family transcriptional regulator, regulatory protein AphA